VKTDPEFRCHERRHMTASEFVTYDTMRAMAKSNRASTLKELVFYGRLTTLANYTNRSEETERLNIKSLVTKGWLIPAARTRWRRGMWGTNRFDIAEHDWYINNAKQYADDPSECPPPRYDPKTGEKIVRGELKPALADFVQKRKMDREVSGAPFAASNTIQ
jgi:hypothetical protein